jgi:hypothetical protein
MELQRSDSPSERLDRRHVLRPTGGVASAAWALAAVTIANYAWQVPYYVHFYGSHGRAPRGLYLPLVLTGCWFVLGFVLYIRGTRRGVAVLASFLVVEVAFYLVHNVSGAAGRDLISGDAVLFIASVLGYLSTIAAVLFLALLRRESRRGTSSG